ncbi:dihydrolipoyl dehydrogenase family protein [Cellulomonas sp.]|uniref:dihydrolipoyl dehydrogenase family protein n=1 Tax=Cellulomonas sp. TaxID=40001 RepID=UPI003BA88795
MAEQAQEFDVVVVGGGAVGENVADRAGRTGLSVALVEHALVGGECSYWACMPSKALLRPGAALAAARGVPGAAGAVTGDIDVAAAFARRDEITHHWDDGSQVDWVQSTGITLLRGHARFTGPRALTVEGDDGPVQVTARHAVVVATGSAPVLPTVEGLAGLPPWTSREATSAQQVPARLAVLGGGVVGVEMATAFADFGSAVTLIVRGDRLLAGAEPFAGGAVATSLAGLGVTVLFGAETRSATRQADGVHLDLGTGADLVVDEVLVATGRRPRTTELGLETLGLEPGKAVAVDDALQATGVDGGWLFAAGDVSGRTATTHQGKYDARVVGDVIAARFDPRSPAADSPDGATSGDRALSAADERAAGRWSRYRATADLGSVPQVVFSRPEVAWVGLTEAAARKKGLDVRVLGYDLENVAGASVFAADSAGHAQLVVDDARGVVVGATFVGPEVAELLHAATIAVVGEVPLDRLWHAVPSYPTVSEIWLRLLETAGL